MRERCTPGWGGWRAWAATSVMWLVLPEQGQLFYHLYHNLMVGGRRAKAAPVTPRKYLFLSLRPDQVPSFENVLKTIR